MCTNKFTDLWYTHVRILHIHVYLNIHKNAKNIYVWYINEWEIV